MNRISNADGKPTSIRSDSAPAKPNRLLTVPNLLCVIRLLASPLLIVLAWTNQPYWCLALFLFLMLTDWLDGKLARLLNQKTILGARLDSVADAVFYACVFLALVLFNRSLIWEESLWLGGAALSYALNVVASLCRFRRTPSYHTRLAKSSWLLVAIAVISIFAGWSVWPLRLAVAVVVVTNVEETAITMVLPRWRVNVPSIFHAVRIASCNKNGNPTD